MLTQPRMRTPRLRKLVADATALRRECAQERTLFCKPGERHLCREWAGEKELAEGAGRDKIEEQYDERGDEVNSNLATAIRTMVVVVMAWGMVFLTHAQGGITAISRRSWLFLILSGLATGASWLCYYRALQMGDASKVVPIDKLSVVITLVLAFVFLHENFTGKSLAGCVLIGAGTLLMVL